MSHAEHTELSAHNQDSKNAHAGKQKITDDDRRRTFMLRFRDRPAIYFQKTLPVEAKNFATDPVAFIERNPYTEFYDEESEGAKRILSPAGQLLEHDNRSLWRVEMGDRDLGDETLYAIARFMAFGTDDQGFLAYMFLDAYFDYLIAAWNQRPKGMMESSQKQSLTLSTAGKIVHRLTQLVTVANRLHLEGDFTQDTNPEKDGKMVEKYAKAVEHLYTLASANSVANGHTNMQFLVLAANYVPSGEDGVSATEVDKFTKRREKAIFILHYLDLLQKVYKPGSTHSRFDVKLIQRTNISLINIVEGQKIPIPKGRSEYAPVDVDVLLIEQSSLSASVANFLGRIRRSGSELPFSVVDIPDDQYHAYFQLLLRWASLQGRDKAYQDHYLPLPGNKAVLLARETDREWSRMDGLQFRLAIANALRSAGAKEVTPDCLTAIYFANGLHEQAWPEKTVVASQLAQQGLNPIGVRGVRIQFTEERDEMMFVMGFTSLTVSRVIDINGYPLGYRASLSMLGTPYVVDLDNTFSTINGGPANSFAGFPFIEAVIVSYIADHRQIAVIEEDENQQVDPLQKSETEAEGRKQPEQSVIWKPSQLVKFPAGFFSHFIAVGKSYEKAVSEDEHERTAQLCQADFGATLLILNDHFLKAQKDLFDEIPEMYHAKMRDLLKRRTRFDLEMAREGVYCQLGYRAEHFAQHYPPRVVKSKNAHQMLFGEKHN